MSLEPLLASEHEPPPHAARVCRAYALSGAVWAVVAATAALGLMLSVGAGQNFGWSALGAGRLNAVYVHAAFFGAISLPLAGALLSATGLETAPDAFLRRAGRALWLWNASLVIAVLAMLFLGRWGMRPEVWAAAPALADGLLWVAALLWAWALWSTASRVPPPLPVATWFGLAAAVGLLLYLGLGLVLSATMAGANQALAGALYRRGLTVLWAAPAAFGLAAAILPGTVRAPLFGRRAILLGLAGWVALGALALPQDLVPDLVPAWLIRPAEAASLLLLVPAVLLGIGLLGTLIGAARDPWTRAATPDPGPPGVGQATGDLPSLWIVRLGIAGTVLLLAAAVASAALLPAGQRILQFTAWDPATGLAPPMAGLWLLAIAAGYALIYVSGGAVAASSIKRHAWVALAGAALCVLPLPLLGLAGAALEVARVLDAAGIGSVPAEGAALLRAEAWLRLPGALVVWFSALWWLANTWRAGSSTELRGQYWPQGRAPYLSPTTLVGATLAVLGASLFVTVFLPLADPTALAPGPRAAARQVVADSLRDEGRQRFVAEGCVACHTQRVRDPADAIPFGPPTERGDFALGPALAGQRRAGPDLAWVGDRLDGEALAARLSAVHGPGGAPSFGWLFETGGPSPGGMAVVDYLAGLRAEASGD
jgi:hypothetical protein